MDRIKNVFYRQDCRQKKPRWLAAISREFDSEVTGEVRLRAGFCDPGAVISGG